MTENLDNYYIEKFTVSLLEEVKGNCFCYLQMKNESMESVLVFCDTQYLKPVLHLRHKNKLINF